MAQILITNAASKYWYTPIASIKLYNEPDFEEKLWRYANEIFEHYHVFKFKHGLTCDEIPDKSLEPDLILVSKNFKKWVIVEVELCKAPSQHTLDQVTCFSNPKIKPKEIADFLVRNNPMMRKNKQNFIDCFSNYSPDLIIVLDDYSEKVFQKFYDHNRKLKICVMEVYKRTNYSFEGYRFGGDYPYELTNSSKLEYFDEQHFRILKKDFVNDLPQDFELKFDMVPFQVSLVKASPQKTYLKMPYHNIPSDIYLQIGKTLNNEYIIQKI